MVKKFRTHWYTRSVGLSRWKWAERLAFVLLSNLGSALAAVLAGNGAARVLGRDGWSDEPVARAQWQGKCGDGSSLLSAM